MKISEYQKLDEALYIWFRQQREKGMPITGPLLIPMLYPNSDKVFTASTGFLWCFCERHGLKELSIQGEKLSADVVSATTFVHEFSSILEGYSLEQIFNCDETGLYYRLLPKKLLQAFLKREQMVGRKPKIALQ